VEVRIEVARHNKNSQTSQQEMFSKGGFHRQLKVPSGSPAFFIVRVTLNQGIDKLVQGELTFWTSNVARLILFTLSAAPRTEPDPTSSYTIAKRSV